MPSNCDVIPLAAHGVFLFLCHRIGSKDPVANTNDQILPFIFVLALSCSSLSLEGRMVLSSERHACRSSPFRDLLDDAVFLSSRRSLRWVKALRFTPPRSCASNPRQEGRPRRRARSGAASSHSTSAVRPSKVRGANISEDVGCDEVAMEQSGQTALRAAFAGKVDSREYL